MATDKQAFDAAVALLVATRKFNGVKAATDDEILFPSSESLPLAAFVPTTAEQKTMFDAGDSIRTVNYKLVIIVREQDTDARQSLLGSLESVARDAISGQSLAGFTWPAMSLLGNATYPKPKNPEQRVEIAGKFTYEILDYAESDVTDTDAVDAS